MADETVKLLKIQVEGDRKVKDLKKEISDLRDALLNCEKGTESYQKVVKALTDDEKKLAEVMAVGKKGAENAAGSYNALQAEMSALRKVWKSVSDEAERDKIGKRIKEINDQLKTMDATIGDNQRKVGSYEQALTNAFKTPQQEIKELRKQLAGLTKGSDEYNQVFARMSELTIQQRKLNQQLVYSSADLGTILSNLAGAAAGVVGGLSAINAAMGLLGDQSEDVQAAMLKVQQFMAITQGLSALEGLQDKIRGLYDGIKTFATQFVAGNAALTDFKGNVEAAAGATTKGAASINTQATTMGQAAASANQLADALRRVVEVDGEEYIITQASAAENKERIALIQSSIAEMEAELKAQLANNAAEQEEIDLLRRKIAFQKENLEVLQTKGFKTIEPVNPKAVKSLEDYNKVLRKLNEGMVQGTSAAQAEATATKGLGDAQVGAAIKTGLLSKALGILRTAIISTGIGALIVALGSLLALAGKGLKVVLDWVTGAKAAAETTNKAKEAQEALNEALEKSEKSWSRQEALLKAQGASYEEIFQARMKNLKAQLAEVNAEIAVQQAIADSIGAKKLQKKKYDEFRETLEALYQTATSLRGEISDLSFDRYVHSVQEATEAEKQRKEKAKRAAEEAAKAAKKEMDDAQKLIDTLINGYKTEEQKLTEKYNKEKALLIKYNKDTTLLTKKYLEDLQKIKDNKYRTDYEKWKAHLNNMLQLLDNDTVEYLNQKLADLEKDFAETFGNDFKVIEDEMGRTVHLTDEARDYMNAYGLTLDEMVDKWKLMNKEITDSKAEIKIKVSSIEFDSIESDFDRMQKYYSDAFDNITQEYERMSTESNNGWFPGLWPKEQQSLLDAQYKTLEEELDKEIELYAKAAINEKLTAEDKQKAMEKYNELMVEKDKLATQKIIDNNNLQIESFKNAVDSMSSISSSISDIFGSMSDITQVVIDNAADMLEAGKITQEEYEKIYAEQFEKNKSYQRAQAVINTIAGAVGAFAGITKDTGGWGIAAAVAEAAAVLAAGYAQVRQIDSTKPGSGTGSSSMNIQLPKLEDYRPEYTQNATAQSDIDSLKNAIQSQNIYVKVTDIDKAQGANKVKVKETTF